MSLAAAARARRFDLPLPAGERLRSADVCKLLQQTGEPLHLCQWFQRAMGFDLLGMMDSWFRIRVASSARTVLRR
jgi:hypothetical protein